MASKSATQKSPKLSKKTIRKDLMHKLETALSEYKNGAKDKKFEKKLKKASKLFVVEVRKSMAKKTAPAPVAAQQ